ncbi:MAG: ABC transporter permease [Chloroflexota bacterium]|nr:ABC transporter permease [Chloroflexota bacterium]
MSRWPEWAFEVLRTVLALVVALIITFIIVLVVSAEPGEAFAALLGGPLGSPRTIGVWLDDVAKLTLAGLALSLVFQARLFALGVQGQAYLGGLAAGVIALSSLGQSWVSIPLGLLAAALTGAVYGWIPGIVKARFGANEIVSTLMLNYIAIDVFGWLIRTRFSPPGSGLNRSAPFPDSAVYPTLIPRTRIDLGIVIAIIAVIVIWFYLYRTKRGFDLRMVGFNARFAEYVGINVPRTIVRTMVVSGIVGGMLGAVFVQGTAYGQLAIGFEGFITFEGILVAIVARNRPLLIPIAALFYGYLRQGAVLMGLRSDVPTEMIGIIQGVVILLVASAGLYGWLRANRAPDTDGDPGAPQPPIIGGGPLTEQAVR